MCKIYSLGKNNKQMGEGDLMGWSASPSKFVCWSLDPIPIIVTIIGDRVYIKTIKVKWIH